MAENFWTEENTKCLIEYIDQGLSAKEISKKFRGAVSRNSVQGRAFRLGLSLKGTVSEARIIARAENRLAKERQRDKARRPAKSRTETPPPPLPKATEVHQNCEFPLTTGLPDALLNLAHGQCKWPMGEVGQPDFHFCTNKAALKHTVVGLAPDIYCEAHTAIATGAKRSSQSWSNDRLAWARQNPTHPIAKRVLQSALEGEA